MHQAERLSAILSDLSTDGSVEVAELASRFGVSAATIRRDLELLEEQRLLARTHGGAVTMGVLYELPLRYKGARHQDEKRRIANAAAASIADGMSVGLTGGTTCTEVARELADRERLTVVTNALNIASELAVRPNLKLVVTGGTARPESYELVGPLAEQSLAGLHLDLVVIGVDGIDAQAGCTTHHEVEAHTDLALIERAERVIVVADSSKIGSVAFAQICPVERIDVLITDRGANVRALRALRDAGVTVETV
ncbi:MAG: DeoR/GlpR family DNA-binding transcription regulator [Actinomycetota bacterium]|nr:DeoR/GlpR family DNA-binding transcription regulator [Actinomycetota bacterium]